MKVILLADVSGQGKKDQVVEVSIGYARNYLFPKKLAVEASDKVVNEIKAKEAAAQRKLAAEKAAAVKLAEDISKLEVVINAPHGSEGRLYGSVTAKDIAEALHKAHGIEVDRHKLVMNDHIKTFGSYPVEVKLYPGVSAKFTVVVTDGKG